MLTTNRISALIDPEAPDLPAGRPDPGTPPQSQADTPSPDLPADRPADDLEPLLLDYIDAALPLEGLANRHGLSLSRLLEIVNSPAFLRRLEAVEAASARRAKAIARAGLADAAFVLRQVTARCIMSDDLHEPARKAASKIFSLAVSDENAPTDQGPAPVDAVRKPRRAKARSHQSPSQTQNQTPVQKGALGGHTAASNGTHHAPGVNEHVNLAHAAEPPNEAEGADVHEPGPAPSRVITNGAAHNGRLTPITISAPRPAHPKNTVAEPPDLCLKRKLSLIARRSRGAPRSEPRAQARGTGTRAQA